MPEYPLCRHVKTSGQRCRAVALNTRDFCYFHTRLHEKHQLFRKLSKKERAHLKAQKLLTLDPLEDRDAVQLAVSQVASAIALGQLETERARALVAALRLASRNLDRHTRPTDNTVRSFHPSDDGADLAQPDHNGNYATLFLALAARTADTGSPRPIPTCQTREQAERGLPTHYPVASTDDDPRALRQIPEDLVADLAPEPERLTLPAPEAAPEPEAPPKPTAHTPLRPSIMVS